MSKIQKSAVTHIDRVIGQRIREERKKRGLTQEELGEIVDVTYQQIQKYEKGQNRVSASRLWLIAGAMEIPFQTFFEDIEQETLPPA